MVVQWRGKASVSCDDTCDRRVKRAAHLPFFWNRQWPNELHIGQTVTMFLTNGFVFERLEHTDVIMITARVKSKIINRSTTWRHSTQIWLCLRWKWGLLLTACTSYEIRMSSYLLILTQCRNCNKDKWQKKYEVDVRGGKLEIHSLSERFKIMLNWSWLWGGWRLWHSWSAPRKTGRAAAGGRDRSKREETHAKPAMHFCAFRFVQLNCTESKGGCREENEAWRELRTEARALPEKPARVRLYLSEVGQHVGTSFTHLSEEDDRCVEDTCGRGRRPMGQRCSLYTLEPLSGSFHPDRLITLVDTSMRWAGRLL